MAYDLTQEQRARYRETSIRSQQRKQQLLSESSVNPPPQTRFENRLDPHDLMPRLSSNGLNCLSLFSGGGGLDLGFERAGFSHRASFEILEVCGQTLRRNRPSWEIFSGPSEGDVKQRSFAAFRGVDVVHGGPPCQPFSTAGHQAGEDDPRNMWSEFIRCVKQTRPRSFVAENVPGLLDKKFAEFVQRNILTPLEDQYTIIRFKLAAHDFGVPQARKRVFFVGFRARRDASRFVVPEPTHADVTSLFGPLLPRNTARRSLGLAETGFDAVAPTLRSGFTGPRKTTGVVNSKASLKTWESIGVWPSGVQASRVLADAFTPENGNFRLSVSDCALLQGFPENWKFCGAVYQVLGQIGNSVCPPVAYAVARNVANALEPK